MKFLNFTHNSISNPRSWFGEVTDKGCKRWYSFVFILGVWITCPIILLSLPEMHRILLPAKATFEFMTVFCQSFGIHGFVAQACAILIMGFISSFLTVIFVIIEKTFRLRIWSTIVILFFGIIYSYLIVSSVFLVDIFNGIFQANYQPGTLVTSPNLPLFYIFIVVSIYISTFTVLLTAYWYQIEYQFRVFILHPTWGSFLCLIWRISNKTITFMFPWVITSLGVLHVPVLIG